MTLDDQMAQRGTCQVCYMYGFLFRKPMLRPNELNAITGEIPDACPVLLLCLTCYATPLGHISDNVRHERLPAEEYLR